MAEAAAALDDQLAAATPIRRSKDGHPLAYLAPSHVKQTEETVELVGRKNRGLVLVRKFEPSKRPDKPDTWWTVTSFRLRAFPGRGRLYRADLADLVPWQGTGADPDVPKPDGAAPTFAQEPAR